MPGEYFSWDGGVGEVAESMLPLVPNTLSLATGTALSHTLLDAMNDKSTGDPFRHLTALLTYGSSSPNVTSKP